MSAAGRPTATRRQRLYESVIPQTLGATIILLSWIVLYYVFDTPWTFEPGPLLGGVALAAGLALAIGFLATFRLLGHKPLPILRTE